MDYWNIANSLNEKMILIPKGIETMRDYIDDEKWISSNSRMANPGRRGSAQEVIRTVNIESFYLMEIPVTVALYYGVMGKSFKESDSEQPITNVSWFESILFCNRLSIELGLEPCYSFSEEGEEVSWDERKQGFRLPTDAEWQYSCRADSLGYRYGNLDAIGWYQGNANGAIHSVKQKEPNKWKLYDMIGNVWEWCCDLYDEKRYGSYRVFRGGSWAEEKRGCGTTSRRRSSPSLKIDDLGFRIARNK